MALALLALALSGAWPSAAVAAPNDPQRERDPTTREPGCIRNLKVLSFGASPSPILLGNASTLSWRVRVPSGCALSFRLQGTPVARQGSREVRPTANARYNLTARWSGRSYGIGTARVLVTLPKTLTIASSNLTAQLVQALGTEGTTIRLRNNVDMLLGGTESSTIPVAGGVTLLGGRTPSQPGPLLRVNSARRVLLSLKGDNIRISGVRIRGPNWGNSVPDIEGNCCSAIAFSSLVNIEVDHNELYGWRHSPVEIRDSGNRIDYFAPFDEVRIHDNFIHHNQNYGRNGYGITVKDGAYANIYRNVFDFNRHAIEGDGATDTGYRAYDNLVLEHGGYHKRIPVTGIWVHTHQFDMHGQQNCGVESIFSDSVYNCGIAGHDMDIRFNSFLYTHDEDVKVRGTPGLQPIGVTVVNNVFKHGDLDDAVGSTVGGAGIYAPGPPQNILGLDFMAGRVSCDVDGNGTTDYFLPTGQTWWWSSGRTRPWSFLKRDARRLRACPPSLPGGIDNPPVNRG